MLLPREIKAEDGLSELALLQHALHDCWGISYSHVGIGHSQDPIKVWIVEGVIRLILTQTKLLVIDDNVLNLCQADKTA